MERKVQLFYTQKDFRQNCTRLRGQKSSVLENNLELYSIFFRSYNTIFLKRIICASLGEFLCAKFEISLQTRKYLVFLVISQMWHIQIRPNTQIILESISILTRIFLTSVLSCRSGGIRLCDMSGQSVT